MLDQYFGMKELYQVVLKAKTPMQFGSRYIQKDEPVLYFEHVNISLLSQHSNPIVARGGWANLPQVLWEDRSDVTFTLSEGVLSNVGLSILFSANVTEKKQREPLLVRRREGPFQLDNNGCIELKNWPTQQKGKKAFIYQYAHDTIQKKVYGTRQYGHADWSDQNIRKVFNTQGKWRGSRVGDFSDIQGVLQNNAGKWNGTQNNPINQTTQSNNNYTNSIKYR